jgi:hypothetical protein
MDNLSKLLFSMMTTSGLFLLASLVLYFNPEIGFKDWALPISMTAGFLGLLTSIIGFASTLDRPKLF